MGIVDQAIKRLEELERAGVAVPRESVGLPPTGARERGAEAAAAPSGLPTPISAVRPAPAGSARTGIAPHLAAAPAADHGCQPVSIDLVQLERAGYLVPTSRRSLLAEEFRHIKRPLLDNARSPDAGNGRHAEIMVTSALPEEGKTFFAINLAMSMAAEVDTAVLLVDADVVRPCVLQRLGVRAGKGLLDLLVDPGLELSDVVVETNVPKLSILGAGAPNDRSTELLASNAMDALLGRLADRYPNHVIVFDAPPLLLTNEAKVLASRVGQVVLVVEASKTPRDVVVQAFAAVEPCPIVLSVLNKAPESATPLGYGYYYG
ncbi:MAG TPA: XrtA-associated tyrosine autokinase [Rubrivivax sp.]|nr:XrtA-associated tyrosine autokinase [Rubrivivax sp.]